MNGYSFKIASMILCFFGFVTAGFAQDESDDSLERDYAGELPRIAPTEPGDTLDDFQIVPGFKMELVAAEPLVHDPIAMAFDEKGRMFVVEMRGYSERRDENIGAIRLLEDTDGDGVYDTSDVYVDGLAWPTAVACYDGGVYAAVPPDIWYFKDTDGDNRADILEKVYTGFGLGNVQGLLNSFNWGMDNRIHGATSSSGGTITRVDVPDTKPVAVGGRDFSFDPTTRDFRATSGGGQHGLTFDLEGNKLICHNSDHLMMVMYRDRYIARNPYLAAPRARMSIAVDGPQADVFRTSPVEPWRIVRTRLRVKGIVPGPVEGGGTASGYFTSATGITVYKGDAWPEEYRGQVFVADVGSNLIHRKRIVPDGIEFKGERIDEKKEFITSTDNWFRPVQFANGPDGALYVADMYREVIEHPASLPPLIKKHIDLNAGFDRGRIYRIVPEDFEQPKVPDLAKATDSELATYLIHPNAWHHDTAARLLHERSKVGVEIEAPKEISSKNARVRVLQALSNHGAITAEQLVAALNDERALVREHALRLSEPLLPSSAPLRKRVLEMADDASVRVRYQLAFTLGEHPDAQNPPDAFLALIASDGDDAWMRLALLSSLTGGAGDVLATMLREGSAGDDRATRDFLGQLANLVGTGARADEIRVVVDAVEEVAGQQKRVVQSVVRQLLSGLDKVPSNAETRAVFAESTVVGEIVEQHLKTMADILQDESKKPVDYVYALSALGLADYDMVGPLFFEPLGTSAHLEVRLAALGALRGYDDDEIAGEILGRWSSFTTPVRREALEVLFSRANWIGTVLNAIEEDEFARSNIVSTRVEQLRSHSDATIRERTAKLFAQPSPEYLENMIAAFRPALTMQGDPTKGKAIFEERCSSCHQFAGIGFQLGPDLTTMVERGAETILVNMIDPNREINPQYVNFTVETTDGQILSGLLDSETSTSVTLKRAGGLEDTLLRLNIREMFSSDLSIMPENLEEGLGNQGVADLIAFLMKTD
ncbi:MAG: PVC-type heme-binding CxxCH protein [Candidatus Hydrogenedentota bacterium]